MKGTRDTRCRQSYLITSDRRRMVRMPVHHPLLCPQEQRWWCFAHAKTRTVLLRPCSSRFGFTRYEFEATRELCHRCATCQCHLPQLQAIGYVCYIDRDAQGCQGMDPLEPLGMLLRSRQVLSCASAVPKCGVLEHLKRTQSKVPK